MILVPMEDSQRVSLKFRKAPYLARLTPKGSEIFENEARRLKAPLFFEYLSTLDVHTIILCNVGAKTAKKLMDEGYGLYMLSHQVELVKLLHTPLTPIDRSSLTLLATLGHR